MAHCKLPPSSLFVLLALLCSSTATAQVIIVQNCTDLFNNVVIVNASIGYNASINTVLASFTDPSVVPLSFAIDSTQFKIVGNNVTVASSLQSVVGSTIALVLICPSLLNFGITVEVLGNSAPQWILPSGNSANVAQYTLPDTTVISASAQDSVTQSASQNLTCSCEVNSIFFAATISGYNSATCTVNIVVAQIFEYQQVSSPIIAVLVAVNEQYAAYPFNSATTTLTITISDTDTVNVQWLNAPFIVTLPYGQYKTVSLPNVLNAVNGNLGIPSPPSVNFAVISSSGNIPRSAFHVAPQNSTTASMYIIYNSLPGSTMFLILSVNEAGTQTRSNVTYMQVSVQSQPTATAPSTTTTPCMVSVPLVLTSAPNAPMFTQAQFQFSVLENVPPGFVLADLSRQIFAKGSNFACYTETPSLVVTYILRYFTELLQFKKFYKSYSGESLPEKSLQFTNALGFAKLVNGTADWLASPTSGLLQTLHFLNYPNAPFYTYTLSLVSPYDNKTAYTATTVTINVVQCNNNPQFVKSAANLTVNTAAIQHVPAQVATLTATSVGGRGSLQYAILDNTDIFSASTQGALYLLSNSFTSSFTRYVSVQACDNSSQPRCSYAVYNISLVVASSSTSMINTAALSWGLFAAVSGVMIVLLIVVLVVWKQRRKPVLKSLATKTNRNQRTFASYTDSTNRIENSPIELQAVSSPRLQKTMDENNLTYELYESPFVPACYENFTSLEQTYYNIVTSTSDRFAAVSPDCNH